MEIILMKKSYSGEYVIPFYGNLFFYLKKWTYSSDSDIVCKSDDEIRKNTTGWLQLHYVTSYVDLYNYTQPIQYTTSDFTKIDL